MTRVLKLSTVLTLLAGCGQLGRAQLPYFTNLDTTFHFASNDSRTVILYTGNSFKCFGLSPRSYFEDRILPKYPQLAARSNLYAVCEQFTYVPATTQSGELNRAFFAAQREFDPLFEKYYIPTFFPTVTFLAANGRLLNGPFWTLGYRDQFSGNIDNYYETLRDYLAVQQPLNRDKAQTNLLQAAFAGDLAKPVFGLFHCLHHTNVGPQELLLGNGATSRQYEIREAFQFTVRDVTNETRAGPPWGEMQYGTLITVAGRFKGSEPFTGLFLTRLNDVWFPARMLQSSSTEARWLGAGQLQLQPGEPHFFIETLDESVALALKKQFERLRHSTE